MRIKNKKMDAKKVEYTMAPGLSSAWLAAVDIGDEIEFMSDVPTSNVHTWSMFAVRSLAGKLKFQISDTVQLKSSVAPSKIPVNTKMSIAHKLVIATSNTEFGIYFTLQPL